MLIFPCVRLADLGLQSFLDLSVKLLVLILIFEGYLDPSINELDLILVFLDRRGRKSPQEHTRKG